MGTFDFSKKTAEDMSATNLSPEHLFEKGLDYAAGRQGELNMVEAHKFFNIAAFKGLDCAKVRREEIAHEMSREEIAQAQREARSWLTKH